MLDIIENHQKEFDQTIERFSSELQGIRTGRATPALVENLMIPAYGVSTRLQELASILVSDPKTITIQPWDKGIINDIHRAISSSNLGFSSSVTGEIVRVSIPPLTEETRANLAKVVSEKAQEIFLALRRIRDIIREEILTGQKDKEITEDDRYKLQEGLDKKTREYQDKIETMKEKKVAEVMTV